MEKNETPLDTIREMVDNFDPEYAFEEYNEEVEVQRNLEIQEAILKFEHLVSRFEHGRAIGNQYIHDDVMNMLECLIDLSVLTFEG